jgi:3-oxoacyl-(acyl-carrier-protein) synthase
MGEGAGVVILEELSHAQKRNAPIYAEVIGYCSTMQGDVFLSGEESFEEKVEGVAACLKEVIDQAGIDPQDVDYLNADGKATLISDRVETEAIKNVFGDYAYQLSISSTKSMMGHLLCASGPAEIIIGTLAMKEGIIPPTVNYQNPDPCCDLEYTPNCFRRREVNTVLSNTMGLSGENAAVLLKKFS